MDASDDAAERRIERATIERLRHLKKVVTGIGKRTSEDVFDLGDAFEEAAGLLRGRFSAWVAHECRIEPRTVLGYRRVATVLGARRESLQARAIAPSVLIRIASAPADVRERALTMIDGGRDLKLADIKVLAPRGPTAAGTVLRASLAEAAGRLASGLRDLAGELHRDPAAAGARAVGLLPGVAALLPGTPLADALDAFAARPDARSAAALAAALAAAVESFAGDGTAVEPAPPETGVPRPAPPARPCTNAERSANRFERSAFDHGLTTVELCAGGGGQAYGLARAGFRHLALVERNGDACGTLEAAFPSANLLREDLNESDLDRYAGMDLLAGGPPCVSYSQAGKRRAGRDARDLMLRAVELAGRLRPRAILFENVMGIFERGVDLHRLEILGRLGKAGFRCEWREVRAWDFGVAQGRRRAILVGFRDPEAMARFAWPEPAPASADDVYGVSSALMHHFTANGWEPDEELLCRLDALAPTIIGGSAAKQGVDLGRENTRKAWRRIEIDPDGIAETAPAAGHVGPPRLTVAMIATLQGFPMDWPFKGGRSPHFKQIANALPPVVAMHLGCSVAAALTGLPHDFRRETKRLATSRRLSPSGATCHPRRRRRPRPALRSIRRSLEAAESGRTCEGWARTPEAWTKGFSGPTRHPRAALPGPIPRPFPKWQQGTPRSPCRRTARP